MLIVIIVTLGYTWIRLRCFSYFVTGMKNSLIYTGLLTLAIGCLTTSIIVSTPQVISLVYPYLSEYNLNTNTIVFVVLALYGLIGMILYDIINRSQYKLSGGMLIGYISSLTIAGIAAGLINPIKSIIRLCIVATEEYIKILLASIRHHIQASRGNDLIMIGILCGLGFGIIENIWYVIQQYQSISSMSLLGLSSMRALTSTAIHVSCTGGIAWIMSKQYHHISVVRYTIYAVLGYTIYHGVYNMSLQYIPGIAFILVIFGYFIVTRYLYDADILYIQTKNEQSD